MSHLRGKNWERNQRLEARMRSGWIADRSPLAAAYDMLSLGRTIASLQRRIRYCSRKSAAQHREIKRLRELLKERPPG